MPNPRLASRYAKSLIDLAIEKGQLELVYQDMLWLKEVCKVSKEFASVLRSPIIKADTKLKIIQSVTSGKLNELSNAFIRLLTSKGRESNLPEIANAAIDLYKQHHNIHTIKLTTATPLTDGLRDGIVSQIRQSAGFDKIELEEKVDPALIGGFVLQVGDRLVDASISYDLRAIAKQFDNNDFIYKIR